MTQCQWFALCERPATGTTPHPILGSVPTCDHCHQFATGAPRTEAGCIRCGKVLITPLDEQTGICAECWTPDDGEAA